MDGRRRREFGAAGIFVRLVGDDGDALDALGAHLPGDHVDGQAAFMRLAAGHGDGVVVEDLVGDVGVGRRARSGSPARRNGCRCRRRDSGRCGRASRTAPGRPIARPRRPSAVKPTVVAVHPQRHEVAADAGARRASRRAPWSRSCAGSPSRRRACASRHPWCRPASPGTGAARPTRAAISSDGPMILSMRSPSAMAMSLGSSAPLAGNSQSPRSSFLPTIIGWMAVP